VTRLRATPLAPFERDGLKSALSKAGLPADDLGKSSALFWRFETPQDVPVGFGGLEIFGTDALLRSIVILPVLRRSGFGRAIVAAIEQEAQAHNCRALYLVTSDAEFFSRQGYDPCGRDAVPATVRESGEFAVQAEPARKAMVKHLVA
jgi:amino-acid N-acetyltransferase